MRRRRTGAHERKLMAVVALRTVVAVPTCCVCGVASLVLSLYLAAKMGVAVRYQRLQHPHLLSLGVVHVYPSHLCSQDLWMLVRSRCAARCVTGSRRMGKEHTFTLTSQARFSSFMIAVNKSSLSVNSPGAVLARYFPGDLAIRPRTSARACCAATVSACESASAVRTARNVAITASTSVNSSRCGRLFTNCSTPNT